MGEWVQPADTAGPAGMRLVLFPYAGAGVAAFRPWLRLMPPGVSAQVVQLPGREERLGEPVVTDVDTAVARITAELAGTPDRRPYALFGHSTGALLAYRTALALERETGYAPTVLGASGWAPEGFAVPCAELAELPAERLLTRVRELGWAPPGLPDAALRTLVLPALRADLALCAGYRDDGAAVSCPVVGYAGAVDHLLPIRSMASWVGRTPRYLGTRTFPGGHLFPREHPVRIVTDLITLLRRQHALRVLPAA
jgi:surfactin synthase thioesterase subunit